MRQVVRWLVDEWRVQAAPAPRRTSRNRAHDRFVGHVLRSTGGEVATGPFGHGWRRTAISALVGAAVCGALLGPTAVSRPWQPLQLDSDEIARRLGFGIEQVVLVGHRFTTDSDIFDALDLGHVRSQFRLDAREVRQRIERLPWVATAAVERELPDRLKITVAERVPFAIWSQDGRDWLIDASGRRLGPNPGGSPFRLPRLTGAGAAEESATFLSSLALFPELRARMDVAERVGERRWTLKIADGSQVLLPADGLEPAFAALMAGEPGRRLIDLEAAVVDLRSSRRVVIGRPAARSRQQDLQLRQL